MENNYKQISKEYGTALINLTDSVWKLHNSGAINVTQFDTLLKALDESNEVTNKTFDKF